MSAKANTKKDSSTKKLVKFLKAVRSELKKVIWPSRSELVNNTIIVIVSVVIVIFGLWILDSIFGFILNLIVG